MNPNNSAPLMEDQSTLTNVWASITDTHTDCEKVVKTLDLIVDGEASTEDQTYFYKHVEECLSCFESYNKEKQLKQFLSQTIKRKSVPSHLGSYIKELIHKLPETV